MSTESTSNPYERPVTNAVAQAGDTSLWRFPLQLLTISWIASLVYQLLVATLTHLMMDQWTPAEFWRLEKIMYFAAPIAIGAVLAKLAAMTLLWWNASTRSRRYTAAAATIFASITFMLDITTFVVHLSGGPVTPGNWYVSSRMYFEGGEYLLLLVALSIFCRGLQPARIRWVFIIGVFLGTGLVPMFLILSLFGFEPAFWFYDAQTGWNILNRFGWPFIQIATTVYFLRHMKRDASS